MNSTEISLEDFVSFQRGFDLPKKDFIEGDYPVVGSTSILGYHNIYKAKGPGLVTGRSGTLGTFQYIESDFWPHNTTLWVKDFMGNNPRFVYYYFLTLNLAIFNSGGAVPTLNRNLIKNYRVSKFSLDKQLKIASILSAYDDMIQNNLKRKKLLEEAAQMIYKEWFVNFRFPGFENTNFIDGIPEKWEKRTLASILLNIKRKPKIHASQYLFAGDYPVIDQGDTVIAGYTNLEEAIYADPLPLIVFGDHTRRLKYINFPFACGADGTQLIYPADERIGLRFLYHSLLEIDLSNYAYARHFKFLKLESILLPDNFEIMDYFEKITKPIYDKIYNLHKLNSILQQARDLLLPKLMTGEIEV